MNNEELRLWKRSFKSYMDNPSKYECWYDERFTTTYKAVLTGNYREIVGGRNPRFLIEYKKKFLFWYTTRWTTYDRLKIYDKEESYSDYI